MQAGVCFGAIDHSKACSLFYQAQAVSTENINKCGWLVGKKKKGNTAEVDRTPNSPNHPRPLTPPAPKRPCELIIDPRESLDSNTLI